MSNPQQPEPGVLDGQDQPGASGPIPVDNQPGHHPAHEQDKPDLNAFAEKLGVVESAPETPAAPAAAPSRGRGVVIAIAAVTALLGILGVVVTRRRRTARH